MVYAEDGITEVLELSANTGKGMAEYLQVVESRRI
jgi:hypothetical protein